MQRQNEIVYTVNDLMDILQVSRRTILKYIKEKESKLLNWDTIGVLPKNT
nr:HTH domain-containing protein [Acholeplasma laidlawii]